jgi:hypothetical protein
MRVSRQIYTFRLHCLAYTRLIFRAQARESDNTVDAIPGDSSQRLGRQTSPVGNPVLLREKGLNASELTSASTVRTLRRCRS